LALYSAIEMRILIADDQREVRSALRLVLEQQAGDCLITEVVDRESLLAEARRIKPDIIIVDAELGGFILKNDTQDVRSLQSAIADLRSSCPNAKVVALTSRPDLRKMSEKCLADVLISKADPPETLINVINSYCC
jgi:DNA-binding NarL/FixJ family response regulator